MGYASAPAPQQVPAVFPWSTPKASNGSVLRPIAVCPFPARGTTLPQMLTAFTALNPGRATIVAPVNPAYPNPPPDPSLAPPAGVEITVNVTEKWVPWLVRIGGATIALLLLTGAVVGWRRLPTTSPLAKGLLPDPY
jgi:hypothetical protein